MSRVAPLEFDTLPSDLQDILHNGEAVLGFMPNDGLVMARRPGLLRALSQLVGEVWGPGRLDDSLKRMVAEISSKTAGCMYCTAHSAYAAAESGVSRKKIESLWQFESSDLFNEAEKSALRFTVAASQSPAATTNRDFEALRQFYDEEEIVELMGVIACFGFLNRWNDNMATGLEPKPRQFAQDNLRSAGWDGGKHVEVE